MKVFYDKDCDLSLIKGKTVAIIGYGSQGHAHAQNLNDSGVKVVVGLRKGGASWDKVGKAGLTVMEVNDAVKAADVVMILLPDEQIAEVYTNNVAPNIKQGASLVSTKKLNPPSNRVLLWHLPTASMCITTRLCPVLTWMCGWSLPRRLDIPCATLTPKVVACLTSWRCTRTSPARLVTWP